MKRKQLKALLALFATVALLMQMACGTSGIENAFAKGAAALRSARQITTTQHKFGHLDDGGYRARLNFFESVDKSVDALGDAIVEAATITEDNKQPILTKITSLLGVIDAQIANANLGVKNPEKQLEFRNQLLAVRLVVVGIQAGINIVKKPTPVASIKVKV